MSKGRSDCFLYLILLRAMFLFAQVCFYCMVLLIGLPVTAWCLHSPYLIWLLDNLNLETCLIFITGTGNRQLGIWERHKVPMAWFEGWYQPPYQKVIDEETCTEQRGNGMKKREKKAEAWWWCSKDRDIPGRWQEGDHLSSATLDGMFFRDS